MKTLKNYEFWFVVGSQFLYGPEVLATVEARAKEMVEKLIQIRLLLIIKHLTVSFWIWLGTLLHVFVMNILPISMQMMFRKKCGERLINWAFLPFL